jgi:hypothetical protein
MVTESLEASGCVPDKIGPDGINFRGLRMFFYLIQTITCNPPDAVTAGLNIHY